MSNRHRNDRENENDRSPRLSIYRNLNRTTSEEPLNTVPLDETLGIVSSSGSSNSMDSDVQHSQIMYNQPSNNGHHQRQMHYGGFGGIGNNHGRNREGGRILDSSENSNNRREDNIIVNIQNHTSSKNRSECKPVTRNSEGFEPTVKRRNNSRGDERIEIRSNERSNHISNHQIPENIDDNCEDMNTTLDDSSIDGERMDILNETFPSSRTIDQLESRNNSKDILKSDKKNCYKSIFDFIPNRDMPSTNRLILENSKKRVPASVDVLNAFECPVCLEYMVPPLFQCGAGHLVCGSCRPKISSCPSCRGPVPNVRNLALEKIAATIYFPCKYNINGCDEAFSASEKLPHEEACEYRPYCCPCPGASCKWQGSVEHVMPHLMKAHRSITTLQGEDIVFLATDISLPGAVDWVMLQSCYECHFMLVLEKQEKFGNTEQFYAIVQLIGSKKDAEKFIYRLELSNQKRRLCWEAAPKSIHEGIASSLNSSDCLLFDSKLAKLFSENGNLGINVTITKV
uniref:E3 ubiquitin-protein ligase n=1 Tax=Strongyloides stercoralis TaxID=6248 RepID=A0A0K0E4I0_STRER